MYNSAYNFSTCTSNIADKIWDWLCYLHRLYQWRRRIFVAAPVIDHFWFFPSHRQMQTCDAQEDLWCADPTI